MPPKHRRPGYCPTISQLFHIILKTWGGAKKMGVFLDDRQTSQDLVPNPRQVGLHESKQRCAEDLAVRGALWTEFGWSFLKYFWFQECHHFTPT